MTDFPYEYGSDLHWVWGWGQRLHARLHDGPPPSEADWMIFRPDRDACDAMMRFSIRYPHVIKKIDEFLGHAEKCYEDFVGDSADSATAEEFWESMDALRDRIWIGVETIAKHANETNTQHSAGAHGAHDAKLFPHGLPADQDVVDLANRLDAENAKPTSERRTQKQIALEFTGETATSDVEYRKTKAYRIASRWRKYRGADRRHLEE